MRSSWWVVAGSVLAIVVAVQVVDGQRAAGLAAAAEGPTLAAGTDVLAGVHVIAARVREGDYRRTAFGESWSDDTSAPGGHNGCDTRNDVLDRDLLDKAYVAIKQCPNAVAAGTLYDPYTNEAIHFTRGPRVGEAVQIDHIVPLALAWDLGARDWSAGLRARFANDPANLLAVQGRANQDKGDKEPADWMPANRAFWCQYSVQFSAVLRGYRLPIDARSAAVLRDGARTCPAG